VTDYAELGGNVEGLSVLAKRVDPVAIVRSLAWANTAENAAEGIPRYLRDRLAPGEATEIVNAIAALAADSARTQRLAPPAEAAFLREHELLASDLDRVRSLSVGLLEAFLGSETALRDETSEGNRRTAFRYAAALLKQQLATRAFLDSRSDAPSLDGSLAGLDRKRAEDFLLSRSMSGPITTVARLVSAWERLVEQLEGSPEQLAFEDYEQGLIARDYLEDLCSLLSPCARQRLEGHVRPLDKRFDDATHSLAAPIRQVVPWKSQRWWWHCLPRALSDDFRRHLEHVAPRAAEEVEAKARSVGCGRRPPGPAG
jgi:hypothetical protein